jgi:hypothetical protein
VITDTAAKQPGADRLPGPVGGKADDITRSGNELLA